MIVFVREGEATSSEAGQGRRGRRPGFEAPEAAAQVELSHAPPAKMGCCCLQYSSSHSRRSGTTTSRRGSRIWRPVNRPLLVLDAERAPFGCCTHWEDEYYFLKFFSSQKGFT
jgi:hypothetical protein